MASERRRPAGRGAGEYEEKHSRFIGELWPVSCSDEAKALLEQTQKKYPDARHHCWAWVLPDGSCRWSDDGEPGGTAGAPIADILRNAHVYGVLCVVTRYFGGTLLGSGGLVRAYSRTASLALADAGTEPDPEMVVVELSCPWDTLDRAHRLLREFGGTLRNANYESDPQRAVLQVEILKECADEFDNRFMDVTGGRGRLWRFPGG